MEKYSQSEIQKIENSYSVLVSTLKQNMNEEQLDFIDKAYALTLEKYDGKRTMSGKPYMLHLIELAEIAVLEMGLRSKSVVAAFLHGIVYKADVTIDYIREMFGEPTVRIVDGFDKISSIHTNNVSSHPERYRKMFLSTVDDIRAILLKIIHRICDFRHPEDMEQDKIPLYINEVKYLYIPIMHRLGLYKLKQEFEEQVMIYEHPVEFVEISNKIKFTKAEQEQIIEDFLKPIRKALDAEHIAYEVKWRTKSIPSIYEKMIRQNLAFEQVFDLFAVRIIIKNCEPRDEKLFCWIVYNIVTEIYTPNPFRLRDWISTPKPSGYQSLHTTVKADRNWVEVQIRTERMDDIAEKGSAAHWQYKEKNHAQVYDEWLNQVREVLDDPCEAVFDMPNSILCKMKDSE